MASQATGQSRPSGFQRQRPTIGGLMMIVAIAAVSIWLVRASAAGEISLALVLAAAIGYPLVAGPIRIKSTNWVSDDPRYVPIDPDSEQVPRRVAESIAETVPELADLGFACRGHFHSEGKTSHGASYVSLFENPEARRTAQLFTVFVAVGLIRHVSTVLSFRSEFGDGTSLATGNSRVGETFPPVRVRKGTISFPWITDPEDLYEIHRASVARYAADGIPIRPEIPDPAEFLRASTRRDVAKFAEVGYMCRDEERRVYRYTWKGAILMTWKLTWPIKPIRQMLRRRKARRILRELGLDHLLPENS